MTTSTEADRQLDLVALRACINRKVEKYLPRGDRTPSPLAEAMYYSVTSGGKRLRPLVLCAAHRACHGVADENLWRTAVALEYLHAFSLIHDDLPCMDDDDLRRGLPTSHKKFGEGIAVLAGDALAVLAFALLAETGRPNLMIEIARAIGHEGMIGGQVADLQAEGTKPELAVVQTIHTRKTAALFRAASVCGGLLADAPEPRLHALAVYGEQLGRAFQIVDDLLDVEGQTELMGKRAGADLRRGKATYPGASSPAVARTDAQAAAQAARQAIAVFEDRAALEQIIEWAVRREA
jgi:geranylgeranyl diphosphate synthase type II